MNSMITKKQEYLSGSFKNIGFAFLTPIGSILFQWVVFQTKHFDNFVHAIVSLAVGLFFMWIGYNFLEEKW